VTNVRPGTNGAARLYRETGKPLPCSAETQLTEIGYQPPDRTRYRTLPDLFVVPRPSDPRRSSVSLAKDEPPLLTVEILSESAFEADLDLVRGKGYRYAHAGLPKYLAIDPTGHYLSEGIRAWRLGAGSGRPGMAPTAPGPGPQGSKFHPDDSIMAYDRINRRLIQPDRAWRSGRDPWSPSEWRMKPLSSAKETMVSTSMHVSVELLRFPEVLAPWFEQLTDFLVARHYGLFSLAGWDGRAVYPDSPFTRPAMVSPRGLPSDLNPATRARFKAAPGRDATWLTPHEWMAITDHAWRLEDQGQDDHPHEPAYEGIRDARALGALLDAYTRMGTHARLVLWFYQTPRPKPFTRTGIGDRTAPDPAWGGF